MLKMKKVTVWYIQNKHGAWEHNHIQDGWVFDIFPHGTKEQTLNWTKHKWKFKFAFMDNHGRVGENSFDMAAKEIFEKHPEFEPEKLGIEKRCPYMDEN